MPFDLTSQNESIDSTVPLLDGDELLFQTMDTGAESKVYNLTVISQIIFVFQSPIESMYIS